MLGTIISVDQLSSGKPLVLDLNASAEDCKILADRFDWVSVSSLKAEIKLKSIANMAYNASGKIEAAIIQRCRITERPVPEALFVDVNERFAVIDLDEDEAEIDPMAVSVEAIENGDIMIGEMIAQLVGLEASPWPKDQEAEGFVYERENDPTKPFASLAELKKKL